MSTTFRRVLLVLIVIALLLPWLTQPGPVLGVDDAPDASDADAGNTSAAVAPGLSIPTGGQIAIIEIDGAILFENQLDSVKRRVDRAINGGADLIVFDLDTPGGVLTTALDLSSYMRTLPLPTVAWVNNQALSAGILIASACDELIMSRAALTGDCAPIIPGTNLAPTERAKALSPLLAEFRANAQDNYAGAVVSDYALFHAMCALGVEVYQVRHKLTGEVRLVSQADYAVLVDGASPLDVSSAAQTTSSSALDGPTDLEAVGRPVVTVTDSSEVGQWALIKKVHDGSTLLTINEKEALDLGLSRATVSSDAELKNLYGAGQALRYEETWSESLVGFLVNPIVRACLLLLGIAGLLMEYMSPGLLFPGIIGLAAIVTLIGAPFLVGLAQTWHLVLIVIGAGLVIYELLTMTTFGVLAVLGLLMFLAGLVLSGVQTATNGLPSPGSGGEVVITSLAFVGAMLMTIPLLFVLMRYFGSLPLLNRLVLSDSQLPSHDEQGRPTPSPTRDIPAGVAVGVTGVVTSTGLRPSGRIEIGDQIIDVTSTGAFIEKGTTVRVTEIHGNLISVEADGA